VVHSVGLAIPVAVDHAIVDIANQISIIVTIQVVGLAIVVQVLWVQTVHGLVPIGQSIAV
jgi:hypothetical protein